MVAWIQEFSKSLEGAWLNNFPWRDVKVKSLPVGIEGVVQAAFFSTLGMGDNLTMKVRYRLGSRNC